MKFFASQIAELLSGKVEGDPNAEVWNVAKIEEGAPGMLSFLANPKYTHYIYETQSSVVIVNDDFIPQGHISATLIRVPDAYASFAKLLSIYQEMSQEKPGISSLSFISDSAKYGKNLYMGEFSYVGKNVVIGDNVMIYPQVYVGDHCVIGDGTVLHPGVKLYRHTSVGKNCILHAGVIVGGDGFGFAPQADGHYEKIPQVGNVVIEDDVEIGSNTTIDRATMGSTYIRKGVKLDNLIMLAHNVEIGKDTVIAAQSGVSGSTKLGANCVVGGQVGFAGHLHIANGSKFGAQSGIQAGIEEENMAFMGSPAIPLRDYQRMFIRTKHLDDLSKKVEEIERKIDKLEGKDE
jgi:UDP-3-O-[3-hydroxymyristoyl] glucosamine N-acyltransferase